MKNLVPYEEDEQRVVVEYLEKRGLKFTSVPNSTWTKSWNQKRKNEELGLRKGFPDLIILLPGKKLIIEMKRIKGGRVSPEQKEWIEALNNICPHVESIVCYGAKAAIQAVEQRLRASK